MKNTKANLKHHIAANVIIKVILMTFVIVFFLYSKSFPNPKKIPVYHSFTTSIDTVSYDRSDMDMGKGEEIVNKIVFLDVLDSVSPIVLESDSVRKKYLYVYNNDSVIFEQNDDNKFQKIYIKSKNNRRIIGEGLLDRGCETTTSKIYGFSKDGILFIEKDFLTIEIWSIQKPKLIGSGKSEDYDPSLHYRL